MHADWAKEPGNFGIKYWYLDQSAGNIREELTDIYEVQLGAYEQTNFLPYIIAVLSLLLIVSLVFTLWICYYKQRKINEAAMVERKQGVAQWGTRSEFVYDNTNRIAPGSEQDQIMLEPDDSPYKPELIMENPPQVSISPKTASATPNMKAGEHSKHLSVGPFMPAHRDTGRASGNFTEDDEP